MNRSAFFICAIAVVMAMVLGSAIGAPPVWWTDPATPVVDGSSPVDNYAPANLGQLKNVAKKAKIYFDAKLPGGAGGEIITLVEGFEPRANQGYTQAEIDAFIADNYAPLNLGQLKRVAKPFYDRLLGVKYKTKANLIARGFPSTWAFDYPWDPLTPKSENYAPANLGQLKMVFSFDLSAPPGQIPDWWVEYYYPNETGILPGGDSDGDGVTNLQEFTLGTNPISNVDSDSDGIPDDYELAHAGTFYAWPPTLSASLNPGQSLTKPLLLVNDTSSLVSYSTTIDGNNLGGMVAKDSTSGGVIYTWEDISTSGTRLEQISDDDDFNESVDLGGFSFPFYGGSFSTLYVSSNGLLTFEAGSNDYSNDALPSVASPAYAIAPLWDDLDTRTAGDVYYKVDFDRVIVQYQNVERIGGSGIYTFQVVLHSDGRIDFRYQSLTGTTSSATVGVQNGDGTQGVQVIYDAPYLESNMAITITPRIFFGVSPVSGSVLSHATQTVDGVFRSLSLSSGIYSASLTVDHDAAGVAPVTVPIVLEVVNRDSTVTLTSPQNGGSGLQWVNVALNASATDPEGMKRVEYYDGGTKIGESSIGPDYSVIWSSASVGTRSLTARAIDIYDVPTDSSPVVFQVIPDTDRDGLSDADEIALGTSPTKIDSDRDGLSDGDEVRIGTLPLVKDTDGDGLIDGFEVSLGTNPMLPDTNGNGMSDGEELKNGGTPWQPGPPPPTFPPPPVNPPPPADPTPTPPAAPTPVGYDILVRTKSVAFPKYGYAPFQETNPAKRYLMRVDQDFHTPTDSSPDFPYQSVTANYAIDPLTGVETKSSSAGSTYPDMQCMSPLTDTRTLVYRRVTSTSTDSNGFRDDGYTSVVMTENTTDMMITNGKSKVGGFDGAFAGGAVFAYRNLHENELQFDYQKVEFKFKWHQNVATADRIPGHYLLVFTPENDPNNPQIIRKIPWTGGESEEFTIDPEVEKPGQDGTYSLVEVETVDVSFGGDKYWELTSDDASTAYSAPQWKDVDGNGAPANIAQGEHNYAVAFTRNTKPKIGAKFSIAGASDLGTVKVKASGSGGVNVPETTATVSGGDVILPLAEASSALVNTIKFYDATDDTKAFKLDWEVKVGNSSWFQVGTTMHTICILLSDPIGSRLQETLFKLGAKNGDGESQAAAATSKIFAEFTDRVVNRADGKQMTYWLNDAMGAIDTPDLLARADANGNCQSWSGLFRDVLRAQGIPADRIKVFPQGVDSSVIVKNWTFSATTHGTTDHPYVEGLDATDQQGIPGQGNANPPGSFNGHWIAQSGGTYYDPSYGTTPVSGTNREKQYEDGAFDGFGAEYQNTGGMIINCIRRNDTSLGSAAEANFSTDN